MNPTNKKVAIIGAGRVGRSLLVSLLDVGFIPSAIISGSEESAKSLADKVGADNFGTNYNILTEECDLIVIAVRDDILENVVKTLSSKTNFNSKPLVVHTSGIQESTILDPLSEKGAKIASMHPAASFPQDKVLPLKDVHFGIEGINSEETVNLVQSMGGIPFLIETGKKAVYHAACTIASGYINTLLSISEELMEQAGVDSPRNVITDLAKTALNGWDETGISAITGSIARGDIDSVQKHLNSLDKNSKNRAVYIELALKTVELCRNAGLINGNASGDIKNILTRDDP